MLNNFTKKDFEYSFNYELLDSKPIMRSLVRIISYAFLMVYIGLVIALFLSESIRLEWLGVLLSLIFIDYIFHIKKALYSLMDLKKGIVPANNLALCVNNSDMKIIISAYESASMFGGDLALYMLRGFLDKENINKALTRLDIKPADFLREIDKEIKLKESKNIIYSKEELKKDIFVIFENVVKLSKIHKFDEIRSEDIFTAIVFGGGNIIKKILDFFGIDVSDIEFAMTFGKIMYSKKSIPKITHGFALRMARIKPHRVNRSFTSRPTPILDKFSKDITDIVRSGAGGFLIGHDEEYGDLVRVLSRQQKKNVILVGDPGVGKSSIVYKLAFNIISNDVPESLSDRRVVEFLLENMIAGVDISDLAGIFNKIIKEINNAGNIILYIPDIHQIFIGKTDTGMRISDFIEPVIRGEAFPLIGSTTSMAYNKFIENKENFVNLFEEIEVNEIFVKDAIRLLIYDSVVLEKKYNITISLIAVKRAVVLAHKYIKTKHLPSSARDILNESIADATQRKSKIVTAKDIERLVERKVNIPIHRANKEEASKLLDLEKNIHKEYINQEYAVKSVSDAIRAYRSGLSKENGPMASFLFVGPTGVGKTELSKIIAKIQFGSRKQMLRFDMSEYQQKQDIVRFIGSPDGKITGALTEDVVHQPFSLILLDEFEKAHSDILNLFLQVLDEGRMTDSLGRIVDFSNTIIIATSNAQSVFIQEKINSGVSVKDFSEELKQKLVENFKPELLNRFSDIIVFRTLDLKEIEEIAKLKLNKLIKKVQEQGISIEFDKSAIAKIAKEGFDPQFGARPLDKAINNIVSAELAKKILDGTVSKGCKVLIYVEGEMVKFSIKNNF